MMVNQGLVNIASPFPSCLIDIEATSAGSEGFFGGLKQVGYGMSEAAADTGFPFMGTLAGVVRGAPAGVPGMLIGALLRRD